VLSNRIELFECIVVLGSILGPGGLRMVEQPGLGFHFLWMLPIFLIFVAAVTGLVIWAVRSSGRPAYPVGPPPMQMGAQPQAPRETPLEILARRFASGEISAEEYERGRDLLGGGGKT
jgi:putative membrane protein